MLLMEAGFAAPEFGTVFNVIVNQEPILEEFKCGGSVHRSFGISTERLAYKQAERRP